MINPDLHKFLVQPALLMTPRALQKRVSNPVAVVRAKLQQMAKRFLSPNTYGKHVTVCDPKSKIILKPNLPPTSHLNRPTLNN